MNFFRLNNSEGGVKDMLGIYTTGAGSSSTSCPIIWNFIVSIKKYLQKYIYCLILSNIII